MDFAVFRDLYREGRLCDVHFQPAPPRRQETAGGEKAHQRPLRALKGHALVLASVSPFLRSILASDNVADEEDGERVVLMPDFETDELESALDAVYGRLVGQGEVQGGCPVLKCLGIDLDAFKFDSEVKVEREEDEETEPKRNLVGGGNLGLVFRVA